MRRWRCSVTQTSLAEVPELVHRLHVEELDQAVLAEGIPFSTRAGFMGREERGGRKAGRGAGADTCNDNGFPEALQHSPEHLPDHLRRQSGLATSLRASSGSRPPICLLGWMVAWESVWQGWKGSRGGCSK